MNENDISRCVVEASLEVHNQLGPGLLESVYQHCLAYELKKLGLNVKTQSPLPVVYDNQYMEVGFRIDILIENKFIVEVKSVQAINDVHTAQILTYLKLTNIKLGMLINFNVVRIKYGLKRIVNGL